MKRPTEKQPEPNSPGSFSDKVFFGKFPLLTEMLVTTSWEGGTPREPSTVSVFSEEGRVKLSLNDKDLRRSAYVSGDTLEGCFKALEAALARETVEWRSWGQKTKKKG